MRFITLNTCCIADKKAVFIATILIRAENETKRMIEKVME